MTSPPEQQHGVATDQQRERNEQPLRNAACTHSNACHAHPSRHRRRTDSSGAHSPLPEAGPPPSAFRRPCRTSSRAPAPTRLGFRRPSLSRRLSCCLPARTRRRRTCRRRCSTLPGQPWSSPVRDQAPLHSLEPLPPPPAQPPRCSAQRALPSAGPCLRRSAAQAARGSLPPFPPWSARRRPPHERRKHRQQGAAAAHAARRTHARRRRRAAPSASGAALTLPHVATSRCLAENIAHSVHAHHALRLSRRSIPPFSADSLCRPRPRTQRKHRGARRFTARSCKSSSQSTACRRGRPSRPRPEKRCVWRRLPAPRAD